MSDPNDDDVLAAEFVLGTLGNEERDQLEQRLKSDSTLKQAVLAWEERFSPLIYFYAEVVPPTHVLPALLEKLVGPAPEAEAELPAPIVLVLRKRVQRWRLATAGALAMAAALVGWIAVNPVTPNRGGRFVAVLQKDASSPAILLDVDVGARRAEIRQVSDEQPTDKSYELWLINPEVGAPRSLGVLRPKGVTNASLAPFDASVIARATYAVTLEQPGGSSSGSPSGPPVLSGKLVVEDR